MARRSAEKFSGQRGKEKRELFQRFRARVIEDVYRSKFFALFDNRCFRCGRPEREQQLIGVPRILCIDHHVPMSLGGHLVPGNLVSLCRDCNGAKLDKPPVAFYSPEELERLHPLLQVQQEVFEFTFDWDRWHYDREDYLKDLGVPASAVNAALFEEDDPRFVGPGNDRTDEDIRGQTVVIRMDIGDNLRPTLDDSGSAKAVAGRSSGSVDGDA